MNKLMNKTNYRKFFVSITKYLNILIKPSFGQDLTANHMLTDYSHFTLLVPGILFNNVYSLIKYTNHEM